MRNDQQIKADRLAALVLDRLRAARNWRRTQRVLNKSIDEWLDVTERALNKVHESEELESFPGMKSYFGLSMLKCNATTSHLKTTYANAIDAPFVMRPSAEPELSKDSQQQVTSRLRAMLLSKLQDSALNPADLMGRDGLKKPVLNWLEKQRDSMRSTILEEERAVAKQAAAYHHAFMRKQFIDGGWVRASAGLFADLIAKPYTVLCGGELLPRWDYRWEGNRPTRKMVLAPTYRHVLAANAYIGSDATSAQDGSGFCEVVERSRDELVELGKLKDKGGQPLYFGEQIDLVLEAHEAQSLDWLGFGELTGDIISKDSPWSSNPGHKIRCVVHQGLVSGDELAEYGHPGHGDASDFHEVTLEVCGNTTIRVQLRDGLRTYFSACYKQYGDSYAGPSVAMMLHDRQLECNRLLFSKNRNAWHASGPNIIMNGHYFQHPEDVRMEPFSVAWANPKNTTGQNWGVQQVNVQSLFGQLHEEIRRTMVLADEESGIPSLFSGMSRGGVSRTTLGGAVLEQTNGERGMNDAMINLDKGIIEPLVQAQHFQNLKRETKRKFIRGDIEIEGRGISALREKELQQRLMAQAMPLLMQTSQAGVTPTPMLQAALKEYFDNTGIDTSAMPGQQAQLEINSFGLNPAQSQDGRSFTPQPNTLGVGS